LSQLITRPKIPNDILYPIHFLEQLSAFTYISRELLLIETAMILGGTEGDLESWKTEMKQYEKAKRTKKPFGPTIPTVTHVTHKDIKTQDTKFNPVLQTYKSREVEDHLKER
jgi:hypothetical protein